VRYKLPVFFCPNRAYTARTVESLLMKYVAEIEKRHRAICTQLEKIERPT
jgi:hypothetical protein